MAPTTTRRRAARKVVVAVPKCVQSAAVLQRFDPCAVTRNEEQPAAWLPDDAPVRHASGRTAGVSPGAAATPWVSRSDVRWTTSTAPS